MINPINFETIITNRTTLNEKGQETIQAANALIDDSINALSQVILKKNDEIRLLNKRLTFKAWIYKTPDYQAAKNDKYRSKNILKNAKTYYKATKNLQKETQHLSYHPALINSEKIVYLLPSILKIVDNKASSALMETHDILVSRSNDFKAVLKETSGNIYSYALNHHEALFKRPLTTRINESHLLYEIKKVSHIVKHHSNVSLSSLVIFQDIEQLEKNKTIDSSITKVNEVASTLTTQITLVSETIKNLENLKAKPFLLKRLDKLQKRLEQAQAHQARNMTYTALYKRAFNDVSRPEAIINRYEKQMAAIEKDLNKLHCIVYDMHREQITKKTIDTMLTNKIKTIENEVKPQLSRLTGMNPDERGRAIQALNKSNKELKHLKSLKHMLAKDSFFEFQIDCVKGSIVNYLSYEELLADNKMLDKKIKAKKDFLDDKSLIHPIPEDQLRMLYIGRFFLKLS